MMNTSQYLSLAECIDRLFQIKLSQYSKLRTQLNSLTRNGLIKEEKAPVGYAVGSRNRVQIPVSELPTIHNAVLIAGILGDPKNTKKVFEDTDFRSEMADWFQSLFFERQSIVGIGLYPEVVNRFIRHFADNSFNLKQEKLPNPFVILPQLALEDKSDLTQALLAQSAMLSSADNMMLAYLNDDIDRAYELSQAIDPEDKIILKYRQIIQGKYKEAVAFEKTLEKFR